MTEADEIRQHRSELKRAYAAAYARLSEVLFNEDPMGINFDVNADEYEPEVGTILPRLSGARSVGDVRRIVHEEFVKWFDVSTAGPEEKYQVIAERLWTEIVTLLPQ